MIDTKKMRADVLTGHPNLTETIIRLLDEIDALTPPPTQQAAIDLSSGTIEAFPYPPYDVDRGALIGLRKLADEANALWADIGGANGCTVVMTELTEACLYTYHLETELGTFVSKPVILPYAKSEEALTKPAIITPDIIGEVIEPIVDMGEVNAREAARFLSAWKGAEKDRPLVRDEGVAKFLEGGGK